MHVPDWYALLVLGLGVYRLCRLIGWDDISTPIRNRLTLSDAAYSQWTYVLNALQDHDVDPFSYAAVDAGGFVDDVAASTGTSELPPIVQERVARVAPRRDTVSVGDTVVMTAPATYTSGSPAMQPIVPFSRTDWYIAKLVRCAWCLGFWCSIVVWGVWQVWPRGTLIVMSLFALSAIPGLIAKNLDRD